jgi:hypothetical protein
MNWKHLGLASMLLATPAVAKSNLPSKAELAASTEQMNRLLAERAPGEDVMKLDLADPAQYNFIVSRLLASGNTPENSPRLFARLKAAQAKAMAGKLASPECVSTIHLKTQPALGTTLYTANAEVGCRFARQDYVFADVNAWQAQEDGRGLEQLATESAEDYSGGGRFEAAAVDFSYSPQQGQRLQVDSLVLSFDDAEGAVYASYKMMPMTGEQPASVVGDFSIQGAIEQLVIAHPRELTGGTPIRICSGRGLYSSSQIDCDYATIHSDWTMWPRTWPDSNPWAMAGDFSGADTVWSADRNNAYFPAAAWNQSATYMPIAGLLDAGTLNGTACVVSAINSARLELFYVGGDPVCGYSAGALVASGDIRNAFSATGFDTAAYRSLATAGPLCGDTPTAFNQKALRMRLTVNYNRRCGVTTETRVLINNYAPSIDIRNSCFAEDTQVLMADGSTKAIQDVREGDKVISDGHGTVLTVTGLGRGAERGKLFQLHTDKGHKVSVTSKHPVLTPRGSTAADSIRVGDKVLTREGEALVTAVRRVPSKGMVYNLAVGTPEELEKVGGKASTLFAGGLLMGDQRMQVELEDRNQGFASARPSVSKSWKQDHENDKARGARLQ